MAESFLIANMDKKQYIDPDNFRRKRDGGPAYVMKIHHLFRSVLGGAVLFLLAPRQDYTPFMGLWAGDRIVFVGNEGDRRASNVLYEEVSEWQDISRDVAEAYYDFLEASGSIGPAIDLSGH